jgi:hypothetical protein
MQWHARLLKELTSESSLARNGEQFIAFVLCNAREIHELINALSDSFYRCYRDRVMLSLEALKAVSLSSSLSVR